MFGNNSFGNSSFGSTTFGTGFGATPTMGAFGATPQTTSQPQGPIGTTIRFVPLSGTDTIQKTGGAGGSSQITTRHQNISAMKEYETKSTEELRLEDYTANRKVGQPQTAFTSTPFSSLPSTSQQSTSIFGTTQTAPNLFATPTQNQTTNIFGQPKTGFELNSSSNIFSSSLNKPNTTVSSSPFTIGNLFNSNTSTTGQQSSFPLFNNNAQTNTTPFGASNVSSPFKTNLFSAPTTSTTSIFGTNNTSGFLNTSQTLNKPNTTVSNSLFNIGNQFSTSTSTTGQQSSFPLFNSTSQTNTTSFGAPATSTVDSPFKTNLFSAPTTSTTSIFGTNNTSGFLNSTQTLNKPNTTVTSSPFNLGNQFGTNTSTTGQQSSFPLFNNTAQPNTTPFGAVAATAVNSPFKTNLFSAPATTSTTSIFGSSNTSGFLNSSQTSAPSQPQSFGTGTSIFGSTSNNTSAFGTGSTLFGANTINPPTETNNLFGAPATNSVTSVFDSNNAANNSQMRPDLLLNRLKTLPYGETSLLLNDTAATSPGLGALKFTTDPKTINQYKMNAKTNVKLNKPSSSEKATVASSVLFDGLDDNTNDDMRCAIDVFIPKKNIKKLDLQPSSHLSEGDADHSTDSPPFERSRSNLASRSLRDTTIDGTSSATTRRVRYADNTFPGSEANSSFTSNIPNNMSANESSDLSSYHNSSFNRSNASTSPSLLNTSTLSSRSFMNLKSGFISTRQEYKIRPVIEEIERRYNSETDTCIISSLLIERPNYGSILFESPLDVRGINLDEIVHIRRKEVVVYPDDENKPPVGQGLNRPAIVTLHQVWPIDKSNSEIIKDVERLSLMRYPEKIEALTIEKGARFIEYRPETGSWVFAVKHFSKYGITDDDEELGPSDIQSIPNPNVQSFIQHSSQNALHTTQNNGLLLNRLKTTPFSETPMFLNNSKQASRQTPNLPSIVKPGLTDSNNKSTNQFKMSAKTNLKLNKISNVDKSKTNSILSDTLDDTSNYSMRNAIDLLLDDDEDLDGLKGDLKRSLTVHGNKRLALQNGSPNVSVNSYDRPIFVGASVPLQQKVRELKLEPNLFAAQNKLSRDIASTCVAGSPKVRFFNGSRKFCITNRDIIVIHELKLIPTTAEGNLCPDVKERLETFLDNNSYITPLNMNPTLAPYIETDSFISNASSHELLHALYGNLATKTPYAKQDERLNRVIKWLASVNQKLPPPTNLYQLIIYHMSCDRYEVASTLAIENNHPRLALLVATLNLNKDLMFEQLSSWRLSTADQYIDHDLLKIYVILAGLTEWKLSNDVTVYSLKGLNWTQQLCLLALHVTSFVTEPEKYGFHMLPLYMKRLDTNTNDVEYHILARHNPTNILSAAETLIDEWFLLESLKSFHVINSESECVNSDIIHCNLASQLCTIDLRWACFVALHIINNEVRNQVLIKCLEQNFAQLKDEKQDSNRTTSSTMTVESWLVEKLQVPSEFIENSKALAAKMKNHPMRK